MNWNWLGLGKRERDVVPITSPTSDGRAGLPAFGRNLAPENSLPRFNESAGGLGKRGRGSDVELARRNLRSAFTPALPVSDLRLFAGRRDLLTSLIRAIEDQHLHVVLYGDRGVGKTSMLHVVAELAREARYIVRYTSCGEHTDFTTVFRAIAADIPLRYHSDFDPNSDAAEGGGVLSDLLPPGTLSTAQVTDLFGKLSGTRVLIILDEFDRAETDSFRRSVAELVKNLSDRSIRVQLLIGGVASNLSELIRHIPSIRRNIIGLPVKTMNGEEVHEHLRIGAALSGLTFHQSAVQAITHVASGSPYLTGLLGQHAGIAALDRKSLNVSAIDVSAAVERALEEVRLRVSPNSLYAIRRADAASLGPAIASLAREALQNGGIIMLEDANGLPLPDQDEHARTLAGLDNDYGLIEPVIDHPGRAYRFRDDGLAGYLWMQAAAAQLARIGRTDFERT